MDKQPELTPQEAQALATAAADAMWQRDATAHAQQHAHRVHAGKLQVSKGWRIGKVSGRNGRLAYLNPPFCPMRRNPHMRTLAMS